MAGEKSVSPKWNNTTKLVVALMLAAMVAGLFIQFRNLVVPVLLSLVLAYLVHPLATRLQKATRIPWKVIATIIYLLILFAVLGLLTWGGFAVVEQGQSLVNFIQKTVQNLPGLIEDLLANPRYIGPFKIDLTVLDFETVTTQVLSYVQPILNRLGTLLGTIASSAASLFGWLVFTLLISYFFLSESRGVTGELISLNIPGYEEDFKRLGSGLGRIWNAFLRGQLLITALTIAIYTVLLGTLGVRYYFGLALLAGMARFVPYIGPAVAWTTYGLVSYFQGTTLFGMQPIYYALVVVVVAWITDSVMDNMVVPRVLADALDVHPAAVMVAALVAANLFGIVGVVLAAPVLASMILLVNYTTRKLSDQDPWEGFIEVRAPQPMAPILALLRPGFERLLKRIGELYRSIRTKILETRKINNSPKDHT